MIKIKTQFLFELNSDLHLYQKCNGMIKVPLFWNSIIKNSNIFMPIPEKCEIIKFVFIIGGLRPPGTR